MTDAIQKAREELRGQLALLHSLANDTTEANWRDKRLYILQTCVRMSDALAALDAETEVKVLDEKAVLAACEAYHADLPTHDYPSRWAMEQAIRAYLASATPADVGEEPVAWQWRSKGWSVDAKWSEWLLGRQPPERKFDPHDYEERPLYSATALERVVRDRDEALKGRDDWKDMFEQAKQKHGYCIVRGNELTDKLSAAEAKLAEARKVIERLLSAAETYRNFRAPTDLPEDESQQWQQLEHQERAARRFLEETK